MTIESLRMLVVAAMSLLGKSERLPPSDDVADAIVMAVHEDTEGRLTGSEAGDAIVMAVEAFHESRFGWHWDGARTTLDTCPKGDGGRAFGYWQLQAREEIGCSSFDAARYWLHYAHGSQARCASLARDERLAELHSGTCARGHMLSRFRFDQAIRLRDRLLPAN